MKTLDRYVIRNFLFSAVLWFAVIMALRTVIDLFVNMDEFTERDLSFLDTAAGICAYYGYQWLAYFAEMGGVMLAVAASFTLARMNHTNELTAMLASGVSLQRVVLPIIVCALAMSGLVVLDREVLIPPVAERIARSRDEWYERDMFVLGLMADGHGTVWYARRFFPRDHKMVRPVVLIRDERQKHLLARVGEAPDMAPGLSCEARPRTFGGQNGWAVTNASLSSPSWPRSQSVYRIHTTISPKKLRELAAEVGRAGAGRDGRTNERRVRPQDEQHGMVIVGGKLKALSAAPGEGARDVLINPVYEFRTSLDGNGRTIAVIEAGSGTWNPGDGEGCWELEGGVLFCPSDLTANDISLRQSTNWLELLSFAELSRLRRMGLAPAPAAVELAQHIRVVQPINFIVMLLLSLPFVVSRERNVKASAALCVLTVGAFGSFVYISRYAGLPPVIAAWLPVMLFGPIGAVMFDSVKT